MDVDFDKLIANPKQFTSFSALVLIPLLKRCRKS